MHMTNNARKAMEDRKDAETASRRLSEIRKNPRKLMRGKRLAKALKRLGCL